MELPGLTQEQINNLPEDPNPKTQNGLVRVPASEVKPNTFEEARLLYGAAKAFRVEAQGWVEEQGRELNDTLFDEETMANGKNFKVDPENASYSMYRQVEWIMSRVSYGFYFAEQEGSLDTYKRDPRVQDALGFSRMVIRAGSESRTLGLRTQLEQNEGVNEKRAERIKYSLDFFDNVLDYLGRPKDSAELEAWNRTYFQALGPHS
ncbi:hypothetical protein EZI54_06760 [Marinobacter halodurans]|uniref:Uncharacterized protein n=1 Tax=Marinobacter halodurans TaxID=2528979 RepID=A0ABY1ZR90_9GAMM|nr:hypothetical protein [Marinobacter halodurans]TBW57351.1 hypothetical protein EZI54_06760 [Marinobacter halodurans]